MQHRHLLSNEIDLLVDGDAGSDTASLLAHVEECDDCRARLDEARVVASAFERVPHFAPRAGFTDRVLGRVQIVEPWHVAALASVRRVLPESRSLRLLTVVGASAVSVFTAVSAIGIALSADVTFGAATVLAGRWRDLLVWGGNETLATLFGAGAAAVLSANGALAMAAAFGAFLAAVAGAALGFRAMVTASRRRGS